MRMRPKPASVEHPVQVIVREPEPDVTHLLPVALAVVRQHVGDDDPAARFQRPCHVGDGLPRFGHMMQHEHHRRHVEPVVVDRQRLEIAPPEIDVVETGESPLGGLQHRRRRIDRDHAADKGRKRRADLAGAAAEIADDPIAVGERRQRSKMHAFAEQLVPQSIPLACRRREELLRFRAPLGERCLKPSMILRGRRRGSDLFANQQPEPARSGVELVPGHRVEVARAFGARGNPTAVGQRFQMAAGRRLRELHDAAELRHGQLVPIEQQQNAAAGRIGERGQVVEDGRGAKTH